MVSPGRGGMWAPWPVWQCTAGLLIDTRACLQVRLVTLLASCGTSQGASMAELFHVHLQAAAQARYQALTAAFGANAAGRRTALACLHLHHGAAIFAISMQPRWIPTFADLTLHCMLSSRPLVMSMEGVSLESSSFHGLLQAVPKAPPARERQLTLTQRQSRAWRR